MSGKKIFYYRYERERETSQRLLGKSRAVMATSLGREEAADWQRLYLSEAEEEQEQGKTSWVIKTKR